MNKLARDEQNNTNIKRQCKNKYGWVDHKLDWQQKDQQGV